MSKNHEENVIAEALLEKAKNIFSKLPYQYIVKHIIYGDESKKSRINAVIDYVNSLSFFIQYSILEREKIEDKDMIFNFWFNVFCCSMNLEDLFSAFIIGGALKNPMIEKALPDIINQNRYEKLKIVEPNKNFLRYRKKERVKSKTISLSIAFNDIERAYEGLKYLEELYSDSFDFFIKKRPIFRMMYKESSKKYFTPNQEIMSLLDNLTSFVTKQIITSNKIFDALERITLLRMGYVFKNYEIEKNILDWKIDDIESFLAKMEIENEVKIDILSSVINKYYIIDGPSLGNFLINEWPHKKDMEENKNVISFFENIMDNIVGNGFIHFVPTAEYLNEQDTLRFLKEYSKQIKTALFTEP